MFSLSRVRVIIYANIGIILLITLPFSTIVLQIRSKCFQTCLKVYLFVQNCSNKPRILP